VLHRLPVQRPDQLKLDVVRWQVLEQPPALPEHDGYQLQLQLVQQPGPQARLCGRSVM
jgi:hypothetical protein